ncbi:MAG: hypothetical protein WCC90_12325 [Methylocella sp.]
MPHSTVNHLINNVLPSANDYELAEAALTAAYAADSTPAMWETAANLAKRRAAELAIAVDGLTDRCCNELGSSKAYIRKSVTALCVWPGTSQPRPDCIERVRGVANAYKHENLTDKTLPITSASDVLVVALGYGLDAFGVGKYSGVEVIVRDKAGQSWKFLGDAPTAVVGWFRFLAAQGAVVPCGPYYVCGLRVDL